MMRVNVSEDGFNIDRKNLFSLSDLNKPQSRGKGKLYNLKNYNMPVKSTSVDKKIRPSDLPKANEKHQINKKILEETSQFNTAKISADSPMRNTRKAEQHSKMYLSGLHAERDDISEYNTSIFKRGIMINAKQLLIGDLPFIKFVHTSLPF